MEDNIDEYYNTVYEQNHDYNSYHSYTTATAQQQQQPGLSDSSRPNNSKQYTGWFWRALDMISHPNFALVFTISIIAVVQFKGPLFQMYRNWVFRCRYLSWKEQCLDVWWTVTGYAWAAWQFGMDWAHRKRVPARKDTMPDLMPELPFSHRGEANGGDGSQRFLSVGGRQRGRIFVRSRKRRRKLDGLEPAFLEDSSYPPGWMVYHPVLGVVLKEVADVHDKKRRSARDISLTPQQHQQPPPQQQQQSETKISSCSPEETEKKQHEQTNGVSTHTTTGENHTSTEENHTTTEENHSRGLGELGEMEKLNYCQQSNGGIACHDDRSSMDSALAESPGTANPVMYMVTAS